jgi:hypothetical protein
MKVNELMIGDWVYNRVADITFQVYPQFFSQWHDRPEQFEAIIQPISLTLEILEKNGFKKLVTYGTEKWIYGDIRMNIYSSNGCWRFCADTKRNENSVIYIYFIHELQHALRLCQIEKEIEL